MAEQQIEIEDTVLTVWNERDRLHIALYLKSDTGLNDPLLDLWDDAAREAFDDGFLKAGWLKDEDPKLKESAFEFARSSGRFDPANRVVREPVPVGWILVHDENGAFMSWNAGSKWIWSSDCSDEQLAKGAYAFSDEENAMDWFARDFDHPDDVAEHKEFMSHISAVEVVLDVVRERDVRPRHASVQSMENAGIDLKLVKNSPTI